MDSFAEKHGLNPFDIREMARVLVEQGEAGKYTLEEMAKEATDVMLCDMERVVYARDDVAREGIAKILVILENKEY